MNATVIATAAPATAAPAAAKPVSDDVAALHLAVAAARLRRRGYGTGGPRSLLPPSLSPRPLSPRKSPDRPRRARTQRSAAAGTPSPPPVVRPPASGVNRGAGDTSTGTIRPVTIAFWTLEEEARLARGLRDGLTIDDLAAAHQRTPTAITARAARMTPQETSHLKREQRVEWLREQLLTDRDYDWAGALASTRRRQYAEVLALAPHTGAIWTPAEDDQVRAAIDAGTPTSELAAQLKRSRKSTARRVRDLRQDTSQPDTSQPDTGTPSTISAAKPAPRTPQPADRSKTAASAPARAAARPARRAPAAGAAVGSAHGQPWAEEETFALLEELRQGMTVDDVAAVHGRSARAIHGRAAGILTQLTGRKHALINAAELLQARLTQSITTITTITTAATTTTAAATAAPATATTSSSPVTSTSDVDALALVSTVLGATPLDT